MGVEKQCRAVGVIAGTDKDDVVAEAEGAETTFFHPMLHGVGCCPLVAACAWQGYELHEESDGLVEEKVYVRLCHDGRK